MGLTEEQKSTYIETAKALKGSDRRMFMARVVKSLGRGGQRRAEAELGWNRCTDEELPTEETVRVKLNLLGYQLRSVQKSRPQKKSQKQTPSSIT